MRLSFGVAFALAFLCGSALARDLPGGQSQACDLLSVEEAQALLGAARTESIDADAPPGALYCAWAANSASTVQDRLTITLVDGPLLGGYTPPTYYQAARVSETGAADIAGIGQAAFAFADPGGAFQLVVLNGDWIALVRGQGLTIATVTEAARLAAARLGRVEHWLSRDSLPQSCALLSLAEAGLALGHFPFVTAGDTPEARGSCTWTYGGTASLSLVTREEEALGGQSASTYFKNALLNEEISRPVDTVDAGERAFISPANPDGRYFYLMVLQNARIALMSGMGIAKRAAVTAAATAAGRM